MDVQKTKERIFFELVALNGTSKGVRFGVGRKLLGSSETCELFLPYANIMPIHAVIEISKGLFKIYDMNSRSGTYINGKKIIQAEFNLNDELSFGKNKFKFQKVQFTKKIPSVLSTKMPPLINSDLPSSTNIEPPLINKTRTIKTTKTLPSAPNIQEEKTKIKTKGSSAVPRVEYPLSKDPEAEFSEYIFEDADELYPIFKYDVNQSAVEIIILFNDRIFSVDYLPLKKGIFNLVGSTPKKSDVEYPYLAKSERYPFVEINDNEVLVHSLTGYEVIVLSDNVTNNKNSNLGSIGLRINDVVRFSCQDIQVFVRRTEAPPKVDPAPFFRRDQDFKKYLILTMFFLFLFIAGVSIFKVDKELEEEKNPERIATILYRKKMKLITSKNPAIEKTKKAPKVVQKAPKKIKPVKPKKLDLKKKVKVKPVKVKKQPSKSGQKTAKSSKPAKKAAPRKAPVTKKSPVVTKSRSRGKSSKYKVRKRTAPRRSAVVSKSKGHVDTYKAIDFKSTITSVLAKGGRRSKSASVQTRSSNTGYGGITGSSNPGATSKLAKVSTRTGSLTGTTNGKIDSTRGMEGLAKKKSIYTVGVPETVVIRGSMDPDVIRKILMDYIPQFRACYQKELSRASSAFDGVVPLNFLIGTSGHVTRAGIRGASSMSGRVKRCVINVLKGIRFPEPLGGGKVEVNQPLNFYPRNK